MRKNIIILVSVILAVVVLYFLFRGKGGVQTTEDMGAQESQPVVSEEPFEEGGSEGTSLETPEGETTVEKDLGERKAEYLKTLNKIDQYFSERIDVLRNEIASRGSDDPNRTKLEQELEKIEKEYDALKQEISKMKSEVVTKEE